MLLFSATNEMKHPTSSSYITRNVVSRALLVTLKSRVRLVPSFVELHCGTVFGYYRLFLSAITRLCRELDPNSCFSISVENCFKRETRVVPWNRDGNGNCSFWHAWLDCYCILKANRGTVYAPIDIPFNTPTPPPPKKKGKNVENLPLTMCPVTIIKEDQGCCTMLLFRIFNANVIWQFN